MEKLKIDRLLFDLVSQDGSITVPGYLPIEIQGKRLFTTKQQVLLFFLLYFQTFSAW